MKISVIGPGRWGCLIAWYLSTLGHNVTIYGPADSDAFLSLMATRKNEYLIFHITVQICPSQPQMLSFCHEDVPDRVVAVSFLTLGTAIVYEFAQVMKGKSLYEHDTKAGIPQPQAVIDNVYVLIFHRDFTLSPKLG